jgi:hypothetical protein
MKVGDLLDARGLDLDLDEEDFLISAVLVASIAVPGDESPRLVLGITDGLSSIEQTGLIAAAHATIVQGWQQ